MASRVNPMRAQALDSRGGEKGEGCSNGFLFSALSNTNFGTPTFHGRRHVLARCGAWQFCVLLSDLPFCCITIVLLLLRFAQRVASGRARPARVISLCVALRLCTRAIAERRVRRCFLLWLFSYLHEYEGSRWWPRNTLRLSQYLSVRCFFPSFTSFAARRTPLSRASAILLLRLLFGAV